MSLIVQLSDLHLLQAPDEQAPIFDALVSALLKTQRDLRKRVDLLAITGDVFESVSLDPELAIPAFLDLLARVHEALGGPVPTVIVPGNHDRRRLGLLGPHRDDLFDHLARRTEDRVFVHGTSTPFLSAVVPEALHGQPFWLIAYDSTYLPRGYVSAGGVLRQEDLLYAASRIDGQNPDWPVLFLLHHHLVPTPLTDVGHIEANDSPALVQWGVRHLLPTIIANADREELTMTALGAGTALSTLHSLDRAVLVLHGHKHYATARLLDGMRSNQGDVLIVSAGSCGQAQPWNPTTDRDVARLWPSFNLIELDEAKALVHTVAFGWKGASKGKLVLRPLVNAQRDGAKWNLLPLPPVLEEEEGPVIDCNQACYDIEVSQRFEGRRWDYRCERTVRHGVELRPGRYVETVDGPEQSRLRVLGEPRLRELPEQLELSFAEPVSYEVIGGLPRSLDEAARLSGARSAPFASIGLMNRYRAREARLEVRGLGAAAEEAFASLTDLGTGLEEAVSIGRNVEAGTVFVQRSECPPRALIRIYWPLERAPGPPR